MEQLFGTNKNGQNVYLSVIENDSLILKAMNYGATLVSVIDKKTGLDILGGFDNVSGYIHHDAHMGGSIGRSANRTKGAQFVINGITYHITANEGDNNLHGGNGFDRQMYATDLTSDSITYTRLSPDGEEGFPGNMQVTYSYALDGNKVIMKAKAVSDKDTVFGWTNHAYYNLDGSDTIYHHKVKINASHYAENAEDNISIPKMLDVKNTPFDFTEAKELGKDINADNEQLIKNRHGYDHYFDIDGEGFREFVTCETDKLCMKVESDLPGMHMYTANYLNTATGKNHKPNMYQEYVCFEPEFLPNSINVPDIEKKPLLRADETAEYTIVLTISENK